MMTVRIYQPCKTAMQSGKSQTKSWIVEFETKDPKVADPLMGWVSSRDMTQELRLSFSCLEDAIRFAKRKGLRYTISNPTRVSLIPKSYGINFTCPRLRGR